MSSYQYNSRKLVIYNLQMIQVTAINIFIKTLSRFREHQTISEIAKDCKKQLKTNIFRVIHLKVEDIIHRFSYFEKTYYRSNLVGDTAEWVEDEKKVFLCFLLAFCRLNLRKISQITNSEWDQVSQAFGSKDVFVLKYQAKVLQRCSQRVRWDQEEDLFLQNSIKNSMKGKWSQVSKQLFLKSKGKFSKTPKQCRERWFNHMDRQVKRGEWNIEEDLIILESVLDYGHKWARVVDLLVEKRTQHMIKNRYHSILTAFKKNTKEIHKPKSQRKIIKSLIKDINKKLKMQGAYQNLSLNQVSSSSGLSNIQQQQQILSQQNNHQPFYENTVKKQPDHEQQGEFIQIGNLQNLQEKRNILDHAEQQRNILYPINYLAFPMTENTILYGVSSYNSLFIYPTFTNPNDVFYNI